MSDKISLLWWNTSLSSVAPQATEPSSQKRDFVSEVIKNLIKTHEVIVLCEISEKDIEHFKSKLDLNVCGYTIVSGTQPTHKSRFDTCLIYKNNLLVSFENPDIITSLKAGRTFKIAQKYSLVVNQKTIQLYACHWPSRLRDNDSDREFIANDLRRSIESSVSTDLVIIAGDFNCDPFSEEILVGLLASPERELVKKKKAHLYNPCWKFLSAQQHQPKSKFMHHGTHYFTGGTARKWHTLDQILFSSSFLSDGAWLLDEESITILGWSEILAGAKNVHKLDHLPVSATIVRKE
jgi:hypothetical protein